MKAYLNKYMGPWDIQTGAWRDVISEGGSFNARFYLDLTHPECLLRKNTYGRLYYMLKNGYGLVDTVNSLQKYRYKGWFEDPSHPTAKEIKHFDSNSWGNYFKFGFVRNPYEKVVSDFVFKKEEKVTTKRFKSFVSELYSKEMSKRKKDNHIRSKDWTMISIEDKISLDFVGKYENLHRDFERVCDKLNLKCDTRALPTSKKYRDYNYENFYDGETKRMVKSIFKKEIKKFGYNF